MCLNRLKWKCVAIIILFTFIVATLVQNSSLAVYYYYLLMLVKVHATYKTGINRSYSTVFYVDCDLVYE